MLKNDNKKWPKGTVILKRKLYKGRFVYDEYVMNKGD